MNQPSSAKQLALIGISMLLMLSPHAYTTATDISIPNREYQIHIRADFSAVANNVGRADCTPVSVEVTQNRRELRELRWRAPASFQHFEANPDLVQEDGEWIWRLEATGGTLRYCVQLSHKRGARYDALITPDWATFRADDLFPAAASVALKGSHSKTTLQFILPEGWSSITQYPETAEHVYTIANPARRFDRPTGWVQLGHLGVRRDNIAQTRVAVSAPVGQALARLELITFLTFTLPTVRDWFPAFPDRLLVVSAQDPLWRGALSGPKSLFLHAERPLVSENGTSTVLHELVHVAMQRQATKDADWIDEGLAEYLSLVLLHRAGGITDRRLKKALSQQAEWGKTAKELARKHSQAEATAKAVTVFAALHEEMGDHGFRQLVRRLAEPGPAISAADLKRYANTAHGKPVQSLPY